VLHLIDSANRGFLVYNPVSYHCYFTQIKSTRVPRSAPGGWSADDWASADELRLLRRDGTLQKALCCTGVERPCVAGGPRASARDFRQYALCILVCVENP
jgi:hypothetical protein